MRDDVGLASRCPGRRGNHLTFSGNIFYAGTISRDISLSLLARSSSEIQRVSSEVTVKSSRGSDLASNASTITLIYLSANQMCRTYPIDQSIFFKIGKR